MTDAGYVKLWRQSIVSPVFQDALAWQVFCWLLLRASHKDHKALLKVGRNPVVVHVKPGQVAIRTRLAAQDLHMSNNTLRRKLTLLADLDCIVTDPTQKYTMVTILNWEKYQIVTPYVPPDNVAPSDTPSNTPSNTPSATHNKKTKKGKEVRGRRRFTPPTPTEVSDYGKTIGFELDGEHFVAYYETRGWMAGRQKMKSWRAAVRTWKIRAKQNGNGQAETDYPILEGLN